MSAFPELLDQTDLNDGQDTARTAPESDHQPSVPTFGDDNIDLPEELRNALQGLMEEAQRQDLYQRRVEVCRDRRNRFYERGMQHVYEDLATGFFIQGAPGAWVPDPSGGGKLQCGSYIADYNIFGRALQIIIAKLTESDPGIDFQPDSGKDTVDEQAAKAAEAYRILFDRRNSVKDLTTAIVRMMGNSGRTVTWTRTEANAARWGKDQSGQPRRVQTTTVYGTLETKVPIMAKSIDDWPYCIITEDPHILIAKMENPRFADKITEEGDDGMADTQFERMARIGALQGDSASFQITDTYAFYCERKYGWFRPAMFMSKSLDGGYQGGTLRDALRALFPDGCCATFIGKTYVGSRNVSMDAELAVDFPYAGDGMSRMAIMDPAVVLQDRFNDDMNAYAEVKDFGWPSTWINADTEDIAAVNDQSASPYCFRAQKARGPLTMPEMFYREPDPDIPESFMRSTEYIATQLLQFILAIPSAVQGAGMPDQKTASGYTAALVQAMGQLGVIWGAVQRLMARVYSQAALSAAHDDDDESVLVVPGPKGNVTLRISDLSEGHFLAHPDTDSSFPESMQQQRATLDKLIDQATKNPVLETALFQSPDNWEYFKRVYGLSELVFVEATARDKQAAEIELLLDQGPDEPTPEELQQAMKAHAQQTIEAAAGVGTPPPPFDPMSLYKSSIQPDLLDFHEFEFQECREFLSDYAKVQEQLLAGNAKGVMNVRVHAHEHEKFIAQQAAAQAALAPQIPPGRPPIQLNAPPAPA